MIGVVTVGHGVQSGRHKRRHDPKAHPARAHDLAVGSRVRLRATAGAAETDFPSSDLHIDGELTPAAPPVPGSRADVGWIGDALVNPALVDLTGTPRVRTHAESFRRVFGGQYRREVPVGQFGVPVA